MPVATAEHEPGSLLIDLLALTGWKIQTAAGERVRAVAKRRCEGRVLTVRAEGGTLAEVSFELFERGCQALREARRGGDAPLAA